MGLDDFLMSSVADISKAIPGMAQGGVAPPSAGQVPQQLAPLVAGSQSYVDPSGKPVDPSANTPVDEIEVTPPPKPKPNPPPLNYDNSQDVQALQQSMARQPRVDGGTDQGLWGLLPSQISHGTVRDILGTIGDAFLTGRGRQPIYQNRINQLKVGQAMAGYENNPEAAIERVANTGVPGSDVMAQKMQEQLENRKIRQQVMEQNMQYHNMMIDSRNQNTIERMAPTVAGWAYGAKDKDSYTAAYNRAEAAAQRVGPQFHASDFGYVDPSEWTPGSMGNTGATVGQQLHADVSRQSIQERRDAAAQASADRRRGQNMTYSKPTSTSMIEGIKARIDNGTANDTDRAAWNRYLHGTKGGGHHTGGGGAAMQPGSSHNGFPVFSPEQAQAASRNPANKGKQYYGADGQLRRFN